MGLEEKIDRSVVTGESFLPLKAGDMIDGVDDSR